MAIRQSEQITEFSESFVKAQAKFGKALKDTANPFFKSKYADLGAVINATLEHLNTEGIGIMQHPELEYKQVGDGLEAYVTVTTRLQHKSGQWIESDLSIPAMMGNKFDAQSVGSAISYACRYGLRSITTVPTADDDGNAATGRGSAEKANIVAQEKISAYKTKDIEPHESPKRGNITMKDLEKAIGNAAIVDAPQLTVVQVGEGKYEITGQKTVMDSQQELMAACGGKRVRDTKTKLPIEPMTVVMDGEQLNAFRYQFENQRHGVLVGLKATWAKQ